MNNSNYIAVNSTSAVTATLTGRFVIMSDAVIALLVTALCSLRVYKDLGKPMLIGIDDENITQVYGQNLANGFGYVYTPNFEHVEGATSPLWVALHYLLYKITAQPEPFILMCCAALTAFAVYWALGIARSIADAMTLSRWTLGIPVLAMAAQPYYFHWTVVTMMDQGLWGALVLGLVYVLVRQVGTARASFLGVALCALSVLARPESMLLIPAMLVIAAILIAVNKGVGAAVRYGTPYFAAWALALGGLTALRLHYFGYPFPNTYYAKVSSNPVDNIVQGIYYLEGFLSSSILVVPCILAVVLALLIGLQALWNRVRSKTPFTAAHSIMMLVGGTLAVVIAITVIEGGDHFPGFRMLQPYVPLLSVALLFYAPLVADWRKLSLGRPARLAWCAGIVIATLLAGYSDFADSAKPLREDFSLAVEGRQIGNLLNQLADPRADLGVIPAGGIAVTYNGRVADLLGLNWVDMAHASGRRTGMVGHSSFNLGVFWKNPPELMLPQLVGHGSPPLNEKQTPANFELWVLQGLMNQPQFREEYRPVLIHLGKGEVFVYARDSFVSRHERDPRIEVLPWERFRAVPEKT